jgi:hypothetical protein
MDVDDRGVDHGVFHVWRVGAGLEKPGEDPRFDPVAIALENSVPVAEQRRPVAIRGSKAKLRLELARSRFVDRLPIEKRFWRTSQGIGAVRYLRLINKSG